MRIVFFGNAEFGIPSLERLVSSPHPVVAVVTNPDKPQGRGRVLAPTSIKRKALELGLSVLEVEDLSSQDFYNQLATYRADLFVVIAFRILPEKIFTLPPGGSVNLHASLLPRYRGAAPIRWVLINGEKKTGVTTFFIEKKVDAGGVILQKETEIKESEDYGELYQRLSRSGAEAMLETVDLILKEEVRIIPQDSTLASAAPKITKEMGRIDWYQKALNLFNSIRGLSPRPAAYTYYKGKTLKILRASWDDTDVPSATPGEITAADNTEGIKVQTQNGQLRLLSLQLEGKSVLSAEEFLRGKRLKVGEKLGRERVNTLQGKPSG